MDFFLWLRTRLHRPLPGRQAHQRFVPDIPDAERRLAPPPADAKQSAVLMPLLFGEDGTLSVVLTLRSDSLRTHKGQISFPGGRLDIGETIMQGALREAQEEIGLSPDDLDVLGSLSPLYIPPSNSAVTPVVAVVHGTPLWQINKNEVEEVLVQPISVLLNEQAFRIRTDIIPNLPVPVPSWDIHPTTPLWGATAMMLNEFITLYHEFHRDVA